MRLCRIFPAVGMGLLLGCLLVAAPPTKTAKGNQNSGQSPAGVLSSRTAPAKPTPGQVWRDDVAGLDFVWVPAGEFWMGQLETEKQKLIDGFGANLYNQSLKDELPRHKVKISRGFWIGRCEVTVGQYRRFVRETEYRTVAEKSGGAHVFDGGKWGRKADANWRNPYFAQTDEQPVVCVSWDDAVAFTRWLNLKAPGMFYRLPTEAEWEYVARAGQEDRYFVWGKSSTPVIKGVKQANVIDESVKSIFPTWETVPNYNDGYIYTSPVGLFGANDFGLKDLAGNAWEWCIDRYGNYSDAEAKDPRGASSGKLRVVRGGSWDSRLLTFRVAFRRGLDQDYRDYSLGFRIVVQRD